MSQTRRASVSPPTRPMSGWTTAIRRARSAAANSCRVESHSPCGDADAAIVAEALRTRRDRRPRAASRGRRRPARRARRRTARRRSTESKAYCTSTMSVMPSTDGIAHGGHHLDDPVVRPAQPLVRVRARRTSPRIFAARKPSSLRPPTPSRPSTRRTRRTSPPLAAATRRASASPGRSRPRAASTACPPPGRRCPRARCRARRSHSRRAPRRPVIADADVQLVPDRLDVERVATEQNRAQPAVHRVRARAPDERAAPSRR